LRGLRGKITYCPEVVPVIIVLSPAFKKAIAVTFVAVLSAE